MRARVSLSISLCLFFVAFVASPAWSQSWSFDPADQDSFIFIDLEADADVVTDSGSAGAGAVEVDAFSQPFSTPNKDFDIGGSNVVGIQVRDLGGNPLDSSADGFAGFRGDGTRIVEVEWSADTLLDSEGPELFLGNADSLVSARLVMNATGLIPGRPYSVLVDWDVVADAQFDHEAGNEDPEQANARLQLGSDLFATRTLVDEMVGSFRATQFAHPIGNDRIDFVATGTSHRFEVFVNATGDSTLANPVPDDLGGTTVTGFARFELVPEPSTPCLLGLCLAVFWFSSRRKR